MAGIFPVDVGPQYEGEVIRKNDMHVEFGALRWIPSSSL
jgi:CO dehydrogenase/acetyl-CoA synthase beta subunit